MQIARVMHVVPPHAACVRRHARKLHAQAEVIVTAGALKAVATRHAGLDCHAVAGFEVRDFGARPDDFASAFVAEAVGGSDFEVADTAGVPEVDVGAGKD